MAVVVVAGKCAGSEVRVDVDADAAETPPAGAASLAAIVRAAGAWREAEGRGRGSRHIMHCSASAMMFGLIKETVFR